MSFRFYARDGSRFRTKKDRDSYEEQVRDWKKTETKHERYLRISHLLEEAGNRAHRLGFALARGEFLDRTDTEIIVILDFLNRAERILNEKRRKK